MTAVRQVRYSLPADLADAVDAVARARRTTPAAVVAEALTALLNPSALLDTITAERRLAAQYRQHLDDLARRSTATDDAIRVIAGYVIAALRGDAPADRR